jgi:hypothetical protein
VIAELYKLASLPVVWCLLVAYAVLPGGLWTSYAVVAVAVVAGGRDCLATALCAVPSRHRFLALKTLTVALLCLSLTASARCVLLSLAGLGLALLTRGVVWPAAFLAGVPILLTPVLRATVPRVVPFLPHEAAAAGRLPVLSAWAAASILAAWLAIRRRDV